MSSIARLLLGLFGWKVLYVPPPGPKAVIIVYPHTSNWDFPIGMLLAAGVPVGCAFIDYSRREAGIQDYLALGGDESADLKRISEIYAGHHGKHRAQEGFIRFAATPAEEGE